MAPSQTYWSSTEAWRCLNQEVKLCYDTAKAALRTRFEPSHRRELHLLDYQGRRRKAGETWGEVADDLRILADKAFPELNNQAKDQLTLDHFLSLLLHTLSEHVDKLNKVFGELEECYKGEASQVQISLASSNHMVQDQFRTAERASSTGGCDKQTSKCSSGSTEDDVKVGTVESGSSDGKSESVKLLTVNPTHVYHITGLVNGSNVHFMLDTGTTKKTWIYTPNGILSTCVK